MSQYQSCIDEGACTAPSGDSFTPDGTPDRPVTAVTFSQAQAYCAAVGGTLPTEAQWEKACRGTTGQTYPWGDTEPPCTEANTSGCSGAPVEVQSLPAGASPYGALHMSGNVWEFTADWYAEGTYATHNGPDPAGPVSGTTRTARGGSSGNQPSLSRCSNRSDAYIPTVGCSGLGFRCARVGP